MGMNQESLLHKILISIVSFAIGAASCFLLAATYVILKTN